MTKFGGREEKTAPPFSSIFEEGGEQSNHLVEGDVNVLIVKIDTMESRTRRTAQEQVHGGRRRQKTDGEAERLRTSVS